MSSGATAAVVFDTKAFKLTTKAAASPFSSYVDALWSSAYSNWTNHAPDTLPAGTLLSPGQQIRSQDGTHNFIYQTDGNLVVHSAAGAATWNSATNGKPLGLFGLRATDTTSDGAFYGLGYQIAIYPLTGQASTTWTASGNTNWNSNGTKPDLILTASFQIQNDGNLVLHTFDPSTRAIWATNTASQ